MGQPLAIKSKISIAIVVLAACCNNKKCFESTNLTS